MVIGCGNTTGGAFNRWAANGTAKSGAASPAGSPTSPARPWSCAAPKATCSSTKTPTVWRPACRTAAGSRSRRPDTRCRATTQRIWWPPYECFSPRRSLLRAHQFADAVVLGVADIDRTIGADDRTARAAETGCDRRTAVTLGAFPPAGDRLNVAARDIDAADRVVLGIDDQDVAAGVESEFLGRVEDGILRRAAVAAVAARPGAGDCIDDPGAGIDGAQRAALPLEDIDSAIGRDLDRAGAEHAGAARRAAIAAVSRLAGSGEGRYRTRDEIDDANAVVGHIGNK